MNSFGRIFRVSMYGESHGNSVGVIVDGCPAGMPLKEADFKEDLSRRKSGAPGTTPRIEPDLPRFLSGVFEGRTTGAPINIQFENANTRSSDYSQVLETPRPGHADFVATKKYGGYQDYRGGGHFSGRLTLGLVAAGVIAKKLMTGIDIEAKLIEAGGEKNIESALKKAMERNDSIGGIVECSCNGVPVGLGEPFFDSAESLISHIVFAIPAIKGIEFGAGFKAVRMNGVEHNDNIISAEGKTETNHAGGINGGITNGNEIIFRVAVKPASSTAQVQKTMNFSTGRVEEYEIKGRHDLCIALRVPPVLEAATAIALVDLLMLENKIERIFNHK